MSDRNRSTRSPVPQPRQTPPIDRKVITPSPQRPNQIPGGGQHGYVPPPPPPPKQSGK